MIDQIKIGDKLSHDDFSASLALRKIGQPKKKVIKESVPFSNITYDFSAINGEVYWEERELDYVFEIIADDPEQLEELKKAFASWVMNIINQNLFDPFIPDYHFIATYDDMSFEDDEGIEKTTATVKFMAYPYKVSNRPIVYSFTILASGELTSFIENKSSHRVTPTITTDSPITLISGNSSYSIGAGTTKDERFRLEVGLNEITIQNTSTSSQVVVSISFDEEVF